MATSLTSLVLNLTPKRPTGASSRDESTISKLLFNLPYLKKCNVNLSNKQSKIFKNFKDKAILTEKMLVSTQAINNSKPISSLFRKEIMFDIAEFLHWFNFSNLINIQIHYVFSIFAYLNQYLLLLSLTKQKSILRELNISLAIKGQNKKKRFSIFIRVFLFKFFLSALCHLLTIFKIN